MVWLISQEWDFAYQIRGDEEADLESCSRWIPSENPTAIYRKSWWGDKSVIADIYISISTETFDIENIKYEKKLTTVRFRYIL